MTRQDGEERAMAKTVWLQGPQTKGKKQGSPQDGPVRRQIRAATADSPEARTAAETLAHVERTLPQGGVEEYRKARRDGVRSFTLWTDPYRQRAFAYVTTKSAAKGQEATYEVLGAAGESLAIVTREPSRGLARTRWTVQQAGAAAVSGRKGRLFWWWVWWLISPIQLAIAVASLIGGDGDVARMPRRTKWLHDGEPVLDWANGGADFHLTAADWWDPRVTAGLVALLKSYDGVFGSSWDEGKSL